MMHRIQADAAPQPSGQRRQVLRNLIAVLEAAGAGLSDVMAIRVFLADVGDRPQMDEVLRELMRDPFPVRTTIETPLRRCLVEIDAIAGVMSRKSLPKELRRAMR
jgi:2-iminobutanoate/2-iminopropanoate deaminase